MVNSVDMVQSINFVLAILVDFGSLWLHLVLAILVDFGSLWLHLVLTIFVQFGNDILVNLVHTINIMTII